MLCINKISGSESTYRNQNHNTSFKSEFVPNKMLSDLFEKMSSDRTPLYTAKKFSSTIDAILNNGLDDVIELTTNNKGGVGYKLNGKKAKIPKNSYAEFCSNLYDGMKNLTNEELKVIKTALVKLNSDLNADDVTKNPEILTNLDNNIAEIEKALRKHIQDKLKKLRERIFNTEK